MANYNASFKDLAVHLVKRAFMLGAKLLGFKAFCLFFTTVLLRQGIVDKDAWLTVIITVLCSASGVHIADNYITGGKYGYGKKGSGCPVDADSIVRPRRSGISSKAKEEARCKIADLCRRASDQLERAGGRNE